MKLSNSFQVQSVSISVIKHNSVFTIERVSYSTESCKLTPHCGFFCETSEQFEQEYKSFDIYAT